MRQEYKKPLFQKGRVLKKEGLETLRDFPYRFVELGMDGWADGILSGFDISYGKGKDGKGQLFVSAGAVWHQGQVVLAEKEVIPFDLFDCPVRVKLCFRPGFSTEDFSVRPMEMHIEEGSQENGGMELGRFRLSKGARLRKDYRDLQDFCTSYNTLDITQVPYAGPGGTTIAPMLLRVFARMVLENQSAKETDVSFALLCLDHPPVPRDCLLWYISRRLGRPYQELSHSEIYQCLVQVAGAGNRVMRQGQRKEGPAVF
ncbi:DNA and RNA helicase [bacterium D16-51]|nr:DNA and RNA helicase [bacterium D16-59]RKI55130.1 DNA and RNA helicase [bacterium D16-51]